MGDQDRVAIRSRPIESQSPIDVEQFWTKGYVVVPNVYSAAEIEAFRNGITASVGPKTDLFANDNLRSVITDGRLVSIARQLLQADDIVYAGDSSFSVGIPQRGYHKDNTDRNDPKAPDWQSKYTILRFGVYLQDHFNHTGGLNLRVGSHNVTDLTSGEHVYVRAREGDVVVWSLRTSHSANARLLQSERRGLARFLSRRKWKSAEIGQDDPSGWIEVPTHRDRMVLFLALGLDDAHHDRYTQYLKSRTYIVNMWRRSSYSQAALDEAAAAGLLIRNLPEEIADDPTVGQNEKWEPTPY